MGQPSSELRKAKESLAAMKFTEALRDSDDKVAY